jgi:hypothetical protein
MTYPQISAHVNIFHLVFPRVLFTILAIVKILFSSVKLLNFGIVNPLVKSRQTQYRLEFQAI